MPHPIPFTRRLVSMVSLAAAGILLAAAQTIPAAAEPGKIRNAGSKDAIPNNYIVVLKDDHLKKKPRTVIESLARGHRAKVKHRYLHAVTGFAGSMSRAQALRLSKNPAVAYVEQDRRVELTATQSPTPSWGLDRIDQRNLPLNNSYTYSTTASGVTAYIIDTGIRVTHSDFTGRAVWGTNTTGDDTNTDCNGHGTHVAGTVGGLRHGVAKRVRLIAVKVLDCAGSGSLSAVAAGIDWVTSHHVSGPAVANLSLGAPGTSSVTETALRNSIADGVTYAVASGNSSSDACNFTPARVAEAITVNATTILDARATFSNFGSCTDIFAPGQGITSASHSSDTATSIMSGTSMATPHVAGAAALVLAFTPTAPPGKVWNTLSDKATPNKVTNPAGSPNRLLFVGAVTPPPPPSGCAPVTNGNNVIIPDNNTSVTSTITMSGCTGNASASTTIEVHIVHTYRGDLVVDLIAPNGTVLNLHNRAGGDADNLDVVYTRNLSGSPANGTWRLRVRDAASLDTGYIDSWTLDP